MYLLSIKDDETVLEASLGGRVDADEVRVMAEELTELFENSDSSVSYVLIDYSKAKAMDSTALGELGSIKQWLLNSGVSKIVNVARDEDQRIDHTGYWMQGVLEGQEEFVLEPEQATFPAVAEIRYLRAA